MAKQGFSFNTIPNLVDREKTWALCVGSGTSFPLFPLWDDLSKRFVEKCAPLVTNSYLELSKRMSAEVILQAAAEFAHLDHSAFSRELAEVLYEDFFSGLNKADLALVKKGLYCDPAAQIDWGMYQQIVESKSPSKITAVTLADAVLSLREKGRAPSAILSFNAEMLLGSLINAISVNKYKCGKKIFDYIMEPTSYHMRERIPYYFCHGVMPIPKVRASKRKFNAADRLVFLENEYLQLANSSYTWQSSGFINALTTHTVFFVGLSFVDPNIRRWLSWIQEERLRTINKYGSVSCSTSHYWIEKKLDNTAQMRMVESSVSHLGVRLIWIDDWQEAGEVLKKSIVV